MSQQDSPDQEMDDVMVDLEKDKLIEDHDYQHTDESELVKEDLEINITDT